MHSGSLRAAVVALVLCCGWAIIPPSADAAMDSREIIELLNRAKNGDATAVDELRQRADTGDPVAQTGLATAYLAGIGVAKDDAEAAQRSIALKRMLYVDPRHDITADLITNMNNEYAAAGGKAPKPEAKKQ